MSTEIAWSATRADAIDRFNGQTPRPEDEAHIIDVFEIHPQLVIRAIEETADALEAGKIRWAWSVLAKRLDRGTIALREATADTGVSRERRIQNAHTWIRNAGQHFDRWSEVDDELFGELGKLRDHGDEPNLRMEMRQAWEKVRPIGELIEQQELERADEWKASRARLRQQALQKQQELEARLAADTAHPQEAA